MDKEKTIRERFRVFEKLVNIGYNTDNYKPEEWGYGVRPAIKIKL